MEKINIDYFGEKFSQLQAEKEDNLISAIRDEGFHSFNKKGVPTRRNEEWKYTNVGDLFKKKYCFSSETDNAPISTQYLDSHRLPGHENANELVFINGRYAPLLSTVRTPKEQLVILPLEEAAKGVYRDLVDAHLGKSSLYIQDGIHALNTSFIHWGVFIYTVKGQIIENPVYCYHFSDAQEDPMLSQPRSLVYVDKSAKIQVVETYDTVGPMDSFTNEVFEIVVNENAIIEYYKLQNDGANASQVGTTHIRQTGKSYAHTVTISLNGGIIRNNTNIVMEVAGNEAHMYGLYLLKGNTHVDNHTLVDNTMPNCFSNELYKGVVDEKSTGVFSGKIFVRPDAQKTNAYQTNNNILLSDDASINTKPQLEIFADDVKCSHGCTVGRLDEEALFYLRTRGISKEHAQAMLLEAFAASVVEQIKIEPLRNYVHQLIEERLKADC